MTPKDLTQGSILGNIAAFSLPYMLAYFLQILYGLADLFVIGRFCGVESTTAVSNGAQVMYMITVVLIGLAMGTTVLTAQGCEYLRGYVWDCIFAGLHFCFSGFFTACGYAFISFLHNSLSIVCARIPLAWLSSRMYPDTLFPMGLSTCTGSVLSCLICLVAYRWLRKKTNW